MNSWPTNGQTSNGIFTPNHLNPAAMYNNLAANFDQFQAANATPTPAFNQSFNPASVVPAKRTHDGSPQQSHMSRSQTPSFTTFPNQQATGQQFPTAPNPYQHLQQPASSNATPSPTMSNQQYRPPQQARMQNASPSPFPQQQQQQQGNFGNQMSPGTSQQPNAAANVSQMAGWNQGMGMNASNMGMPGMPSSMAGQMNNMMAQNNVQRMYQMKLQQQQEALRRSGMVPPRTVGGQQGQMNNVGGQQGGAQMANGQATNPMMSQQQFKRNQFLKALQSHATQQGRQFQANPVVSGRPIDLYMLWSIVCPAGGSSMVERNGQWPAIANKFGLPPAQYPTAAEEMKQIYIRDVITYERAWFNMKAQQKQEQARMHAHQMAGLGAPTPSTPNRTMQPPNQQNQYPQFQQGQQGQQGQQQPQATPVQAHAQLPQNGMTTPQQMMHHRRNSSIRKVEQMTPQPGSQPATQPSPASATKVQRSPSIKQEYRGAVMKREEAQSTNYVPNIRSIEYDGGYDVPALQELGSIMARVKPNMPSVDEMGIIDMRAITLSLASGIHSEVRYALDALVIISRDERIHFELEKCEDLIDVLVDCAEEQVDLLAEEAAEVSDALDLPSYEDIMRGSRTEADTLQEVPAYGTQAYDLDRAADRIIALTTMMRNFSFYEHNHALLTSAPLVKWLSHTIRLLGTRHMLLRTLHNTLDFYKDVITFLSNITQSLELPSRDDALHVLHFLLAFAPQPAPTYSTDTHHHHPMRFAPFLPAVHRYLPPAVDCLAKLLARQDPNRQLYRSIFTVPSSASSGGVDTEPLDLLTRAFALSISVLPDRSRASSLSNTHQLRIVEARKSYLCQGMLAADILATLAPGNDVRVARAWMESEDGWVISLLHLASLLSVDRSGGAGGVGGKGRDGRGELGHDTETFKLITHRALGMMRRLAEKAGKGGAFSRVLGGRDEVNGDERRDGDGEGEEKVVAQWEGIPQGHAILGALMMPNTDKVALGLLCGLHDLAMQ